MSPDAAQTLEVSGFLSEQYLSTFGRADTLTDEGLLSGARASRQGDEGGYVYESRSDTVEAIPFAAWVEDILPSLRAIEELPPNWDSYGSPPPPRQLTADILRVLHHTEFLSAPSPAVVPASGGGVQLEWATANRELEIDFSSGGKAQYLATDLSDGREFEGSLEPRDYAGVRSLLSWLLERS